MAKISARGAVKLAEASRELTTEDGTVVRYHYVLCSDGRVLRAFSLPHAERAYDRKRSSYSVLRAWSGLSRAELVQRFCVWAVQKDMVLS